MRSSVIFQYYSNNRTKNNLCIFINSLSENRDLAATHKCPIMIQWCSFSDTWDTNNLCFEIELFWRKVQNGTLLSTFENRSVQPLDPRRAQAAQLKSAGITQAFFQSFWCPVGMGDCPVDFAGERAVEDAGVVRADDEVDV